MARTKQTVSKQPKLQFRMATFPPVMLRCPEPGCSRYYTHRQSLRRHKKLVHDKSQSILKEAATGSPRARSIDDQTSDVLLQSMEGAAAEACRELPMSDEAAPSGTSSVTSMLCFMNSDPNEAVMEQPRGQPSTLDEASTAARSTVAAVRRTVAPMKEMRSRPQRHHGAADAITRRWRLPEVVSTDTAYNMLTDMASYSPFAIAAAARRRFALTGRQQLSLRKRLSMAAHTERRMIAEVRELLPSGSIDGSSAIVCMSRLHDWLQKHSQRPPPRVNE